MRFSPRPKVSIAPSLMALFVLVGAFAVSSFVGSPVAQAATSGTTFKATLSTATEVAQVKVTTLGTGKGQVSATTRVMPLRARPTNKKGAQAAIAYTAPGSGSQLMAHSSSLASATLLHNFDGVNAIQNTQATHGIALEPPDESIATDGNYVLNLVNLTGAIYTKQGALAAGPFPLGLVGGGGLFKTDLKNIVSDPRAYYDQNSQTWFALVWEDDLVKGQFGPAYVDLAVNTGNPVSTAWTIYKIDVSDTNAAGCPCLPDYTTLGVDQYNVYLLPNEFENYGPGFNGSQIYVLAKSQLTGGVSHPNVVHFSGLSLAGVIAYHLQPAIEYSNASAEYFINALDPNSTFDNRLGVWAMTNRDSVAQGVIPTLSATVIQSEPYGFPVPAQTPAGYNTSLKQPTTGAVSPDFDALQEVEYINGKLYGALNTSVTVPGSTGPLDGIAWFEVTPSLSGGVIDSSTSVSNQSYIASQGLYLLYPHINVAQDGDAAIVFSYGGPTTYLSAAYVVKQSGAKDFGPIQTAAAGVAPDNGFTAAGIGRWGDYSAGQLDPSGNGIWLATQYIPNNGDKFANWGNRIFEVQV
jgi:hypothetical protein